MIKFLDENKLWDNRLHGSGAGRSTVSQLLSHYGSLLEAMENGNNIETINLDFFKVYDKVDLYLLIQKVKSAGINGNLGSWIGTFILE